MIAAMGLITPITAQATDETVIIDKEEYAEYKEYQDYKKSLEKYGKDTEIDKNTVKTENISEDRYNEENDKSEKKDNFFYCFIIFAFFIFALVKYIQCSKDIGTSGSIAGVFGAIALCSFILLAYLVPTLVF